MSSEQNKLVIMDNDHDLIYNPDDEKEKGMGWHVIKYLHNETEDTETSQLFATSAKALDAFECGEIEWE